MVFKKPFPYSHALKEVEIILLSYEQERQWFLEQLDPGDTVYNRPYVLKFTGTLSVDILERCLNLILLRHEILRARFPANEGVPQLVIMPHKSIELTVTNFSELAPAERAAATDRLVLQEAAYSFDIAKDTLFRFVLIRCSQAEHVLVSVFHHIVFDGWSAQVFLRELAIAYTAFSQNVEPVLPSLLLPYTEYAARQREVLSAAVLDQHLAYWKNHFPVEPSILELPLDHPRPVVQGHAGSAYKFILPADITSSIKSLCRAERITLFMYLTTVLKIVLYRYTSQADITVGCLVAGRSHPGTEQLIGLFVNTLPIKTNMENTLSFRALLTRVREVVLEAFNHQEMPYAKLVAALSPVRRLNTNPIFQVMLNMHNMPRTIADVPGVMIEELDYDYKTALIDLCLKVSENNGTIACSLIYDKTLFEAGTIERLAGHFQMVVQGSIATPGKEIARLPLLTEQERVSLLEGAHSSIPARDHGRCIQHYFEEQAVLDPAKVALVQNNGQEMTYGELNRRANQLAHYLRERGVRAEVIVAVCLEGSFELIITFLAILKAGGAYLPLDLAYPAERLSHMLQDSQAAYAIVTKATTNLVPFHGAVTVCLESEAAAINAQPEHDLVSPAGPDSLAYVMYTSGSTGKPKGVAVLHKGIIRLVKNIDYAQLGPQEVFLQLTTTAFDVSAFEIYGSLLNGGKLVLMDTDKPSMMQIGKTIQQYNVTSICSTPEILQVLLDECPEELLGLRQIIAAGDVLPVALAIRIAARLPECRLINAYGPTENSVYTTAYTVANVSPEDRSIPIGRPIANDRVYILDKYLQLLPVGIVGDLYASGDGIARGYLYNPELTTEKFVPDPFSTQDSARLYKTGDLARYLPDGNIEFIGRADKQVKVRGCRIELGEIETVISQHPDIRQCIITATANQEGVKSLIAYVVLREKATLNQSELRSLVRLKLPDYMVPSSFIAIAQVPLTPVGKIDHQALLEHQIVAETGDAQVAPRNATEQKLAELWEKLLNLPKVGVTDNFFDLGGHSLLAMRMFADIERTFNNRLSVSILFQEDTIERLAKVIDGKAASSVTSSLVPIQTAGTKPPLFCVHPIDGEVIVYRNLALHLGESQPVYGLKLGTFESAEEISIEALATKYVREIRRCQPKGPYYLLGYSLGGIVAYEMAQQLNNEGQEVALLGLIDTKNPQYYTGKESLLERWASQLQKFRAVPFKQSINYLMIRIKKEYKRIRKRLTTDAHQRKMLLKRQHAYIPLPYSGRITVLRASKSRRNQGQDPELGWGLIATGGVTVIDIPGDHASILAQQNAAQLAKCLAEALDEARI